MRAYFVRVGKVHRGYLSHPVIVEMKVRARSWGGLFSNPPSKESHITTINICRHSGLNKVGIVFSHITQSPSEVSGPGLLRWPHSVISDLNSSAFYFINPEAQLLSTRLCHKNNMAAEPNQSILSSRQKKERWSKVKSWFAKVVGLLLSNFSYFSITSLIFYWSCLSVKGTWNYSSVSWHILKKEGREWRYQQLEATSVTSSDNNSYFAFSAYCLPAPSHLSS